MKNFNAYFVLSSMLSVHPSNVDDEVEDVRHDESHITDKDGYADYHPRYKLLGDVHTWHYSVCLSVCVCACVCVVGVRACVCVHMWVCGCVYVCMYMYVCMHVCMYVHDYVCTSM